MTEISRIILFGGSFDPIHTGHLSVAQCAIETLAADKLFFIPARRSPHKQNNPSAAGRDRMEMIRLAVEGKIYFQVSDCELLRPQPSYTLDTVMHFHKILASDTQLFWLAGADAVSDLPQWRSIERVMQLCRICIMYRGGFEKPDFDILKDRFSPEQIASLRRDTIQTPLVDISSSQIRGQLATGLPSPQGLPEPVLRYIRQKGLYGYIPPSLDRK